MNSDDSCRNEAAKITDKGQIAIPKDIRELEGFEEGDKVAILAFEDRIEVRPLKQLNERIITALASEKSLAKDWLSKEDEEAWKDLYKVGTLKEKKIQEVGVALVKILIQ